jgi:hypothetical protein
MLTSYGRGAALGSSIGPIVAIRVVAMAVAVAVARRGTDSIY